MANERATAYIMRSANAGARVPSPFAARAQRQMPPHMIPVRRRSSPSPRRFAAYRVVAQRHPLGQNGDAPASIDDIQKQKQAELEAMAPADLLRYVERFFGLSYGSLKAEAGLELSTRTGISTWRMLFSGDALLKVVGYRDRLNQQFWDTNILLSIARSQDPDTAHVNDLETMTDKLHEIALSLQQMTDQAGIQQPARPLSGFGEATVGLVVAYVIALIVGLFAIYVFLTQLGGAAAHGGAAIPGEIVGGINRGASLIDDAGCNEANRQAAILYAKGVQNLTQQEKAALDACEKKIAACRSTWFAQITQTAAIVGSGYLLWRILKTTVRGVRAASAGARAARKAGKEAADESLKETKEKGLFAGWWGKAREAVRGESKQIKEDLALQSDFKECYRTAVTAAGPRPKTRGPTPKAWKDAYANCATTKFTKVPTKISTEFKRLAKLTGME